ncbi:hypothetical protein D3C81_1933310 [compost metagenome]
MADMARSLVTGETHRTNGEMALHVLEIMHAFHTSSDSAHYVQLKTSCERPAPLQPGLVKGYLDPA